MMVHQTILIVEDERIVARDIEESLSGLGYQVVGIASEYGLAVELATEYRPDLVLMDVVLDGNKDGIDAAQKIRTDLGIPIVFLTAHADPKTIERAKTTEPYGYVLKPFEERELHICVGMALHKHRMEGQLRTEQEWLATVMRSIGDAVITTDDEGCVITLNPVAEVLTGWSQTDAEGMPLSEVFFIIDEETRQRSDDPVKKVLDSGKVVGLANHTILISRDGIERPIADSGSPIRDLQGRVSGVVLVFRDASHERELSQANRLSALGELAGGVAHSLNNMLMAIIGFSNLALDKLGAGESARDNVEKAREAAYTSEKLTAQILAFAGKQIFSLEVVNLNDLVAEAERLLSQLIEANIEIRCVIGEPVFVKIDRSQVMQVVLNLALNARDAMPDGGTLKIEVSMLDVETESIFQPIVLRGRYATLTVSDTGIGMDSITCARVFEPFFTQKPTGKGTGLGLAVAHGVMKQSGGYLLVDSKPGEGSIFTAYFPCVSAAGRLVNHAETRSGTGVLTPKNTEVILVVEDEALLRDLIKEALELAGFTVLLASSGHEALSVGEQYDGRIHLLLSDVVMPGLTGPEVVDQLAECRADLKVLYMSGYTQDTIISRWDLDPGVNFVKKPVSLSVLVQKVRAVLDS